MEVVGAEMVQTWPYTVFHTVDVQEFDMIQGLDFGNHSCNSISCTDSCLSGRVDEFVTSDGDEPTSPSPALIQYYNARNIPFYTQFDDVETEDQFIHTLFDTCSTCWQDTTCVAGARLTIRMKAGSGYPTNDGLTFREDGISVYSIYIKDLNFIEYGSSSWNNGDVNTFHLDLANLPPRSGITNILATLQDGDLDITVQDDTSVDFMSLEIDKCAPSTSSVDLPSPDRNGLWAKAYPNPFNPRTRIDFNISVAAHTNLSIYDLQGRRVIMLLDEFLPVSQNSVAWDGRNSKGKQVSAGVYFFRLESGTSSLTGKLALIK